jgi:hypothetical protein
MGKRISWGDLFPILWPRSEWVILRYRRKRGQEGSHCHPVVQFELPHGRTIKGLSQTGWWNRPWPEGTRVGLRYCPDDPRRLMVKSLIGLWGIPVAALILLILLLSWLATSTLA